MRKRFILSIVSAVVLVGALLVSTYSSQASTSAGPSVDLGITGSTVAGYTAAQSGQELPVSFTMTNHSTTTSTQVSFNFTVTNATAADIGDYVCTLISNHFDIYPDTPSCEPGSLPHGKSTSAAIMVSPTIGTGTVTVKACTQSLDGYPDPVSSNNCKTIKITIE